MQPRLFLTLVGGAALAACGPARETPNAAADAASATDTGATNAAPAAAPTDANAAAPTNAADLGNDVSDATAPGDRGTVSCSDELGAGAAERLVQQCTALSPATHPPCNVQNSCAIIRREIARSCSVIAAGGTAPAECPAPPKSAAAAVETIRNYYSAIDARDYATAWAMWDGNGARSGKSPSAFAAGFRDTVSSFVSPGSPGRIEGAAGSAYVTVPVTVRARLADGTRQQFTGSYVLRRSNMDGSQGWAIYSATLKQG